MDRKKLTRKQVSTLRTIWICLSVGICFACILWMVLSPGTETVAKPAAVGMLCLFFLVLAVIDYFDPERQPKTRRRRVLYWVGFAAALLFVFWWYFIYAPI